MSVQRGNGSVGVSTGQWRSGNIYRYAEAGEGRSSQTVGSNKFSDKRHSHMGLKRRLESRHTRNCKRKGSNFLQLYGTSLLPWVLYFQHTNISLPLAIVAWRDSSQFCLTSNRVISPVPSQKLLLALISSLLSAYSLDLLCFQLHCHLGFRLLPEVPAEPRSHITWEDRSEGNCMRAAPNC